MKHIIFDLDGTLVDSLPGIAASLNRTLVSHGLLGHSHANVRRFIGDGARKLAERALVGVRRTDLIDSVVQGFAKDYGLSWKDGTVPYAGIPELLKSLRENGDVLCVFSNKPHPFTTDIVGSVFEKSLFTEVLGNKDGAQLKPDPAGALTIINNLGVAPADCIYIGDSSIDIETAKNAGMKSIAVTWGYHDRDRLQDADQFADTVEELSELLLESST